MIVYWLFTDEKLDILKHGYVGISNNFKVRLAKHRSGNHL